jgi:hypothetical protein
VSNPKERDNSISEVDAVTANNTTYKESLTRAVLGRPTIAPGEDLYVMASRSKNPADLLQISSNPATSRIRRKFIAQKCDSHENTE